MPTIIERTEHRLSQADVAPRALDVMEGLQKAGFHAYLVGGGVRDLLLGHRPKDFDIATDALPEEVKNLFSNCRLIGRRFRLAHVYFRREVIEVATFRAQGAKTQAHSEHGMILRDNVYGNMDEDAERRDFTINALYYDSTDHSVVDYYNGMDDIKQKVVRLIGDPEARYREDPVRMLRAVRFAAKLNFDIEPATAAPIPSLAPLLANVSSMRLFEEMIKLYQCTGAKRAFQLLMQLGLFSRLFPVTAACLANNTVPHAKAFIEATMQNADERMQEGRTLSPAFLFASLLWGPVQIRIEHYRKKGMPLWRAFRRASGDVISEQVKAVAVPKRYTQMIRNIWRLQYHLVQRRTFFIEGLLHQRAFRAAYDFLLLRAAVEDESLAPLASWWTDIQFADNESKKRQIAALRAERSKR